LGSRSSKVISLLAKRFPHYLHPFTVLPSTSPTTAQYTSSLIDYQGFAYRDYGIDGDTLLIVCPDGYIGTRVADPDEAHVLHYLSRLLPREMPVLIYFTARGTARETVSRNNAK
jgi:hypothetical protein